MYKRKNRFPTISFFSLIPFAIAQKILGNKTNPTLLKVQEHYIENYRHLFKEKMD